MVLLEKLHHRLESLSEKVAFLFAHEAIQAKYIAHFKQASVNERSEKWSQTDEIPEGTRRVMKDVYDRGIHGRFYHVHSDYYTWPYWQRALAMNVPSTSHLCKSVIFENTKWAPLPDQTDILDPRNSRYYCVLVQYVDKINAQKLLNFVRDLNGRTLSKKYYNMRVANEQIALELTAFGFNAVSPFGMTSSIPLICTQNITELEPPVLFLGAGHTDWKLALRVDELVDMKKGRCMVTDLS